ncbi:MAG: hypothetical protein H6635_04770 [Anaerolineales bacterium]|nr:hypothetical protein [Anaerolineales bacterium]
MYRTTQNLQKDNELADFADRLLNDGMEQDASSSNVELISLEKTILNLKETFPPKKLDEDKARRMLAQVKLRARQEKEPVKQSFFQRLFDFQSNPQVGLLAAVAAVVILVIVGLPSVGTSGEALSGAALSDASYVPALGILVVLFILYWISRRK